MQQRIPAQPEVPRSKDERYRTILGTLARHGFGAIEDHFVADDAERDRARATRLRQACDAVERLRDSALDMAQLSVELPRRIDRVLGEIERGNLRVWTRLEDTDPVLNRLEHMVERANATILAAACIVALAIVLQIYRPHGWQQWIGVLVWIALIGAVAAAVRTLLGLRKMNTALLDVDGTLVDSNRAHARAWEDALGEFGFRVPSGFLIRLIGMGGDKILRLVPPQLTATAGVGKKIADRRQAIFLERYLPAVRPTPGARRLVERLRADGIACVVASSAAAAELRELIARAGVSDLIAERTGKDDAARSKPDPDIIVAALEKAGIAAEQAVLIGDTPYDVLAGLNAGVPTIALRCGGWEDEALSNALATYDDPADLATHYEDVIQHDGGLF